MATPQELEDQEIYNAVQAGGQSFVNSLDDQQAEQMLAAVERHEKRQVKPVPTFKPRPVDPNAPQMSAGIPDQANYRQLGTKIPAFIQDASGGLAQRAYQDLTKLGKHFGLVDQSVVTPKPFEQPASEQSGAFRVGSAMAGGLATPSMAGIASAAGNLGKLATAGLSGAQGALMGAASAYDSGAPVGPSAIAGGVIGGGLPLVAGGLTKLALGIRNKIGQGAFQLVHDVASRVLMKDGKIDPAVMQQISKPGTSKMGFENRLDDLLYIVVNKLQPGTFNSNQQNINKMGQVLSGAQNAYAATRDPIRKISVPAEQLTGRLQGMAQNLSQGRLTGIGDSVSMDPKITKGPDAAQIIRSQVIPQYKNAADLTNQTVVQMGQGYALPQQINAFNVPQAGPQWAPQQINPAWGQFSPQANMQVPTVKQAQKLNQALDPRDYQYIVDPKGKDVQAPAWLTGSDVGPVPKNEANWSAFNSVDQTPTVDAMAVPAQVKSSTVPLQNLDRARSRLRSPQYEPAGKFSDPSAAKEQAARGMEQVFLGYGTPEQRANIEAAKVPYEQVKDTSDIFMQNWAGVHDATGHGLAQTVKGSVLNRTFNAASNKMNLAKLNTAKSIADRALVKMNKMTGQNLPQDRSYFEDQTIKRMFEQISQMSDKDAMTFTYAASMMNPSFRRAWMKAQEDNNE